MGFYTFSMFEGSLHPMGFCHVSLESSASGDWFQELSQIKALHGALVQRFAESHVRLLVLVDLQDSEQDLMTQELGRASWPCRLGYQHIR